VDEIVSVRRAGATYYYLQDALGSVARVLDQSRNVKNSYSYLSWGEIRTQAEQVSNRYTYTGRERDPEGGTLHYRARMYAPDLGRFASEDPLGFGGGSYNLYIYVGNSPCSFTDPTGEIGPWAVALAALLCAANVVGGLSDARRGVTPQPEQHVEQPQRAPQEPKPTGQSPPPPPPPGTDKSPAPGGPGGGGNAKPAPRGAWVKGFIKGTVFALGCYAAGRLAGWLMRQ
jgi:RHS repeat-associated protein